MYEKPLERLNYYNGRPLDAADFKTEQEYHIRTRRWLNKSLYAGGGIAHGLEVSKVPGNNSPRVLVTPGLALDGEGREIILLDAVELEVCSFSGSGTIAVQGNYLVIEYQESKIAIESGSCIAHARGSSVSKPHWGGPSRIQSQVKFSWLPYIPHPTSGQIVLARVELKDCTSVDHIDTGARHYIGQSWMQTVRQFALEGESEIAFIPKASFPAPKAGAADVRQDVEVVGRIYFHIRGRQSPSVTLHLRSEKISPLHYTELGSHTHGANSSSSVDDHTITLNDISHVHGLTNVITDTEKGDDTFGGLGPHVHWIFAKSQPLWPHDTLDNAGSFGFVLNKQGGTANTVDNDVHDPNESSKSVIFGGAHRHELIRRGPVGTGDPAKTDTPESFTQITLTHTNVASATAVDAFGAKVPSRDGDPLAYVDDLQIFLGIAGDSVQSVNRTNEILIQLANSNPVDWGGKNKIGNSGLSGDVLKDKGTGPIRLDYLNDTTFVEGEYCIELRVAARHDPLGNKIANGGKILYNLYVE